MLTNQTLTSALPLASNVFEHPIQIEYCGGRTSDVRHALSALQRVANHAALITEAGVQLRAFKAMFKANKYLALAKQYLWWIYSYHASINLRPSIYQPSLPRIACVTPDSRRLYSNLRLQFDPWQWCLNADGRPFKTAFYAGGTVYTFICPSFFQLLVEPPRRGLAPTGKNCPRVHNNELLGDIHAFYLEYQVYTLFDAMIRLHLGKSSLSSSSTPAESFGWNDCIRNDGPISTRNPTNYGLFAARQ